MNIEQTSTLTNLLGRRTAAWGVTLTVALAALSAPIHAEWPVPTNALQNFTSPAIGDVNGDGTLDLVFGGWDGRVRCVSADGSEHWNVFLSDDPDQPFLQPQLASSPTLVDLDGDPDTLEVLIGSGIASAWGRLYVLGSDGTELARFDTPSEVAASPLVVDSDGDGTLEAYFGASFAPFPYYSVDLVPADGGIHIEPRWVHHMREGGSASAAAAGNLRGDDRLEIVVAASGIPNTNVGGKNIVALSSDGELLWRFETMRFNNTASPTIVDLTGDGRLEVLQSSSDGNLYCLDGPTGDLLWTHATGHNDSHTPAVADLNADGSLEIVIPAKVGATVLQALDAAGRVVWTSTAIPGYIPGFSSPSVGDLDGDGQVEIVIGLWSVTGGALTAFDRRGQLVWQAPQAGAVYSSPALADLDGDGRLEIAFGAYDGHYHCLTADGTPFELAEQRPLTDRMPWPSLNRSVDNIRALP